jgi:hypothetical protein
MAGRAGSRAARQEASRGTRKATKLRGPDFPKKARVRAILSVFMGRKPLDALAARLPACSAHNVQTDGETGRIHKNAAHG